MNEIYKELDVKTLINAAGTYTDLGGSKMSANTLKAMVEASRSFIDIRKLQSAVNKKLSEITKNEAACVTNGAAAGIFLAVAAAISIKEKKPFKFISKEEILSKEIVMFASHRNPFDASVTAAGAKIRQIGYPNTLEEFDAREFRMAINEKTVGILYEYSTHQGGWLPYGDMKLEDVVSIAGEYDIPVIVDAAAQLPPASNLWSISDKGVAAVIFSGGKDLCGPQSSGLVVGKKDFIDVINEINFPNHGGGRMLKTGREEIVGLLNAVKEYLSIDFKAKNKWYEQVVEKVIFALKDSQTIKAVRRFPNEAGEPVPRAQIIIHDKDINIDDIMDEMMSGDPPVMLAKVGNELFFNPKSLDKDEADIAISRLIETERKLAKKKNEM